MEEIENIIEDLRLRNDSVSDRAIQIIRELQKQIPKWHLVAENDLPSEEESLNSKLCFDEYRKRCVFARYVYDRWILGNGDEPIKIVAWTEIPKFEEIE